MTELSTTERAKLAAQFIAQSPPGEINDVINAIRAIVADDDALMPVVSPALKAYNLAQFTVVEHPASGDVAGHTSILSESAILPGSTEAERYIDAAGKQSFAFDHVNMAATDYEPYELPEDEETFRAELAKSLTAYTKNHYPTGQSAVNCNQHPLLPPAPPTPPSEPEPIASPTATTGTAITEGKKETADVAMEAKEDPVTDVVPEQAGAGDAEPAPTPAVGGVPSKVEEVDQPGGLEKLDEAVEEAKEEDQTAAAPNVEGKGEPSEAVKTEDNEEASGSAAEATTLEPEVVEEGGEAGENVMEAESIVVPEAAAGTAVVDSELPKPLKPERKQERIENPIYTLEVVGNRYKIDAYWTGRWRTRWVVDKAAGKVSGTINVDVHYFEQGNVQLATKHESSFDYPAESSGQTIASQIVTTISKIEEAYQLELQDVYGDLGDKAFRALRRALPVTRQKVDWEKVGGYSLGSDISKARA